MLQIIQDLTKEVGLSLDGEPTAEPPMPNKAVTIHKNKRLTPAKLEAWKMWQQDGLTAQKIAVRLLKMCISWRSKKFLKLT